jgi:5-deoxy-glucuronate isomerase
VTYHLPQCTDVTPESAGWAYSGLRILDLPAGAAHRFATGPDEVFVVPLSGACTVRCDGFTAELAGRPGVFAGVTDFAYAPRDTTVTVSSAAGGRFAVPTARARRRLEPAYVPRERVPVELRGAGNCSRQVNNFGTPDAFPAADRLIACEVLTPSGNWSSYPPHKHDEDRPGESVLEEIYYFEVARGGMAYQRLYADDIDVLAEVRGGDVVLVPRGWHGPSMAAPGYDLYYLNIMAGPGDQRAWLVCDDPAHGWIRETWADQPVDPRLPFGSTPTGPHGQREQG